MAADGTETVTWTEWGVRAEDGQVEPWGAEASAREAAAGRRHRGRGVVVSRQVIRTVAETPWEAA